MMKDIIVNIFGMYEPIYTEVNGVITIPNGLAGVDIPYVAGVVLFIVVLVMILTFIRMVFK